MWVFFLALAAGLSANSLRAAEAYATVDARF